MQILRRLLGKLAQYFARKSGIQLSDDMLKALRLMAKQNGRSEHDLTVDLIHSGYAQQQVSWELVRCWRSLTPHERQVVALICCNYTNRQIAEQLVVSVETVRSHVSQCLRKFGVRNRRELSLLLAGWQFDERYLTDDTP